uniref:Transmembrane protein 170B n=1 Tax=Oryzias sinensis TaxID=183150 RepID=A0A8C7ZAY9_9TELE
MNNYCCAQTELYDTKSFIYRNRAEKEPRVSFCDTDAAILYPVENNLRLFSSEMWYWVFLWCLFSSLFVHGAMGLLMLILLQRHRWGRLITVVLVSGGFLASLSGGVITSAAVAGVYRVAGKNMAPLEALVLGVGQTMLSIIISFSRVLATL